MKLITVIKVVKSTAQPNVFRSAVIEPEHGGLTYTIGERRVRRTAPMLVFDNVRNARHFAGYNWDRFTLLECVTPRAEVCPGITSWMRMQPYILPRFWRWLLDPNRKPFDLTFNIPSRRYRSVLLTFTVEYPPEGSLMVWSLTPVREMGGEELAITKEDVI